MPEWFRWSGDGFFQVNLRSYDLLDATWKQPAADEQVRQRIMRQLLAEGLKPNTSKFTRKLELELRRHANARRRPRPEIIDTPKKKPKKDEQTRRSRQEANRVRDEEEI